MGCETQYIYITPFRNRETSSAQEPVGQMPIDAIPKRSTVLSQGS